MALGSTQPLTEMRNLSGGKKRTARRADNLVSRMSENVGASTSRNPKSLHGLYRENFAFTIQNEATAELGCLNDESLIDDVSGVNLRRLMCIRRIILINTVMKLGKDESLSLCLIKHNPMKMHAHWKCSSVHY
jgi:hypothetical protein